MTDVEKRTLAGFLDLFDTYYLWLRASGAWILEAAKHHLGGRDTTDDDRVVVRNVCEAREFSGFLTKFDAVRDYTTPLPDGDVVIVTDAIDVLFNNGFALPVEVDQE